MCCAIFNIYECGVTQIIGLSSNYSSLKCAQFVWQSRTLFGHYYGQRAMILAVSSASYRWPTRAKETMHQVRALLRAINYLKNLKSCALFIYLFLIFFNVHNLYETGWQITYTNNDPPQAQGDHVCTLDIISLALPLPNTSVLIFPFVSNTNA
jgi:hypothetical protein